MQSAGFGKVLNCLVISPGKLQVLRQLEMDVASRGICIGQAQMRPRGLRTECMLTLRTIEHPVANGFDIDRLDPRPLRDLLGGHLASCPVHGAE